MPDSIIQRPLVAFGREVCGRLDEGLRREWLVTNGLGGYASGTVSGVNTRRYHGWLVAALTPPVSRTLLVGGAVEWGTYRGRRYALSTHEFAGGTIHPAGYVHLQSFALEGMLPVWVFALADALVERRLWMIHGANATCVAYRLLRGTGPVDLEIAPLVTYRDAHTLTSGRGWRPAVEPAAGGIVVRASEHAAPLSVTATPATFVPGPDWYWNFYHREEADRGLDASGDLFAPGAFHSTLTPDRGAALCLVAGSPLERGLVLFGSTSMSPGPSRPRGQDSSWCWRPTSSWSSDTLRERRGEARSSPAITGSTTGAETR